METPRRRISFEHIFDVRRSETLAFTLGSNGAILGSKPAYSVATCDSSDAEQMISTFGVVKRIAWTRRVLASAPEEEEALSPRFGRRPAVLHFGTILVVTIVAIF